jgi:hypothetical protein
VISHHSLIYRFVPLERRRLCRRVHALGEHVRKCKATNEKSLAGLSHATYEVRITRGGQTQWEVVRQEESNP